MLKKFLNSNFISIHFVVFCFLINFSTALYSSSQSLQSTQLPTTNYNQGSSNYYPNYSQGYSNPGQNNSYSNTNNFQQSQSAYSFTNPATTQSTTQNQLQNQPNSSFYSSPNFSSKTRYPSQSLPNNTFQNNGQQNSYLQNQNYNTNSSLNSFNQPENIYPPTSPKVTPSNSRWDGLKDKWQSKQGSLKNKQKEMAENFQKKKQARDERQKEKDRLKVIERENELLKEQQQLRQQSQIQPVQLYNLNKKPSFKEKFLGKMSKKRNSNSMSLRAF